MVKGVIDLRKQVSAENIKSLKKEEIVSVNTPPLSLQETAHGFDLEWSAYEHEYRIRGQYWFLYPLTIGTVGIVYGIVSRSYLFVVLVCISFAILTYYAKQMPRLITYRIEKRGIWIQGKLMDFGKLKSFWIFTHAFMVSELLLETAHPINPIMHIRLENISHESVRHVISQYLPEKEQKNLASDQIARIIGF